MKRSPLRKVGKKRAAQQRKYLALRKTFLEEHPLCEAFCVTDWVAGSLTEPQPSSEIHHMAGREGKLLLDERHWLPICRRCHDGLHIYRVKEARENGWLYEASSK